MSSEGYVPAELVEQWLLTNGFAEERRGYGHVAATDLALALVGTFHMQLRAPFRSDEDANDDKQTR